MLQFLLVTSFLSGATLAADEKPLPKKVEFELNLWQSRLGLKKIHMRELNFAARTSVAKFKAAMKKAEELGEDPWALVKPEEEPWASIALPRAIKSKDFVKVAAAILSEQQIASLVAFKKHAKRLHSESMQQSRIHARLSTLTKFFYLTESQRAKAQELLTKRARMRANNRKTFKGREDEAPTLKPIRQSNELRALLDPNQLKLLKKEPEN